MNQLAKEHQPSLFNAATYCTVAACILSFLGVLLALHGSYFISYSVILVAVWLDMLDGYIARKLHVESDFGGTLDLLQDVINYLIYPSVLFFLLGFQGVLPSFILCFFVLCGLLRLARFHTIGFSEDAGTKTYLGMPVYFVHCIVFVFLLLESTAIQNMVLSISLPIASILMVSKVHFFKSQRAMLWTVVILGISLFFLLK